MSEIIEEPEIPFEDSDIIEESEVYEEEEEPGQESLFDVDEIEDY